MDLPTCPHCGQSVLDDEVDECPFCGESMSAKPSGKKKAQPAPAPAEKPAPQKTATKTKAKAPAKKTAPASESPGQDEPFAVDKVAMSSAIPMRPKPTKGRTYKVVCPMCETPGYTSPKAGGREVKCANPKCLVPIFTCPEPPPAPVEEAPPEPAGLSTTQLGLISVAFLAAVGAGLWYFVFRNDGTTAPPANGTNPVVSNDKNSNRTDSPENTAPNPKPQVAVQPEGPDLAKLRAEAPERMVRISQQTGGRLQNRNKPLSVHWIAVAYAEMGEVEKAQAQMDRLSKFGDDEPHYRVLPWVEIGWRQREREESAKDAADKALRFSQNVPASLQGSWNEAVSLSALLSALDRAGETAPLMKRDLGDADDGQLWLDVMSVSLNRTFNLEAAQANRPLILPANPAWSGVVWQLVFHDEAKAGLDWAKSAPSLPEQSEALIAWGEAVVANALLEKQPADAKALEAAIAGLPGPDWQPVVTARAYARMGQRYAAAGNQAQAESMLKTAQTALQSFPKLKPMPLPGMKDLYEAKFPATGPLNTTAAAAFEVARLQAALQQTDAAWQSIQQGLNILRSLAPSPTAVATLEREVTSSPDFVRSDLQSALGIQSGDEARRAFRTYSQKVNGLKARAELRFGLQASLLSHAARWKLADKVQAEILKTSGDAGPSEPYLETDLPWIVLAELRGQGSAQADALAAKLKELRLSKPPGQALVENSRGWMKDNQIAKLAENLGGRTEALPEVARRRWILRLASQTVLSGETEKALSFVRVLFKRDPFMGEDAAELISALATATGRGETVWQELEQQTWSPTQQIAAYRGFIAAVEPPPPEETKAETKPKSSKAN